MRTTYLKDIPANSNPYHHDAYHMGMSVGVNVEVMMENHSDKRCKYLIVVDKESGERLRIDF